MDSSFARLRESVVYGRQRHDVLAASAIAARQRYARLRERVGRLVPSNYDVSDRCNLRCEGCLFFEGDDFKSHADEADLAAWDAFFAREAGRGVNYAYLAGAEPTLELDRLAIAYKHIGRGTVFTNGTRRLPPEIGFRVHVSLWGASKLNADLRHVDNGVRALRLYAGDPRALFAYTINRLNIGDIYETTRMVADHGGKITFSYYSPTTSYLDKLRVGADKSDFFHRNDQQDSLTLQRSDFTAARAEIERAMDAFPEAVLYSLVYDDWITAPDLYALDAAGIAINCGNRQTPKHFHFYVDLTRSSGKCCSPNVDCRDCRAYAMGYATFLTRLNEFRGDPEQFERWLTVWESWAEIFLPLASARAE